MVLSNWINITINWLHSRQRSACDLALCCVTISKQLICSVDRDEIKSCALSGAALRRCGKIIRVMARRPAGLISYHRDPLDGGGGGHSKISSYSITTCRGASCINISSLSCERPGQRVCSQAYWSFIIYTNIFCEKCNKFYFLLLLLYIFSGYCSYNKQLYTKTYYTFFVSVKIIFLT